MSERSHTKHASSNGYVCVCHDWISAVHRPLIMEIPNGGFQYQFRYLVHHQYFRMSLHYRDMQAYLRAYAHPYVDQMAFAGQFGDIFRTIHYPVCYKKNVYGTSVIALHYLHPLYFFAVGGLINCDTAA